MTELTIRPLHTAAVEYNKLELAAAVQGFADKYAGLVVTDKATAKRDRAEVNRILKQIDDARKDVKRRYEAPLKAFEADLKDIIEPLKASAAAIDAQIKAIEEQERADRRQALVAAYNASGAAFVPFERIFDPSWLNASVSESKAVAALQAAVVAAENDIAAIKAMHSQHEAAMLDRYNEGATLAEVLAYAERLDQMEPVAVNTAAVPEENPLNVYTLTDTGVVVTAKQETHNIMVTCSPTRFDLICAYLDNLGVFFVTD
jgi:hypothetical protein